MHVDRRFLGWGVFLVAVGAVPLAVRAGLVTPSVRWWDLWPLLLVGWGVGLILGRTAFGLLGRVLVSATVGVIVGGVLATGAVVGTFASGCGSGAGTPFAAQQGTFDAGRATVTLEPGCGQLDVSVGGTGWQVSGSSTDGTAPRIDTSPSSLAVHGAGRGFDPFAAAGGTHWEVVLPANQPIDLSVAANAGQARLALADAKLGDVSISSNAASTRADFSGTSLAHLTVTANAGDARLVLPAANTSGSLTANAGSIAICVPAGTGVRISQSDSIFGGNNFDERGLSKSGDTWTSIDYVTAATHVDLTASANAGSVSLNPDGGCG
ncbi:MAG TPA: hypothetical protein VFI28_02740 [Candidatus Limnocylindrales bacterium]|nr:hypothetical protein [Candidatus Limnocylindrales bacterium]